MWGSALWVGTPPIRDSWGRLRASFSGAPPTPGSSASACSRDSAAALAEPSTERGGKKREDPTPQKFTQPISSKWPQIEYVKKLNCMKIFFFCTEVGRVCCCFSAPIRSKPEKRTHACACVCVYLLESSGWGRQDGSTEFLHGADGSREGWSREQRRHQVYPKDPGHHLLFTPVEGQRRASKHIGDYDEYQL